MPDVTVHAVEPKGEKAAILVMNDGSRIWTPEIEKAQALVGKPIPDDWTRKEGDYGPQAFPPRAKSGFGGGGAAAFRNTKEGMAADQAHWDHKQAIDQERTDRRTALMQAVEHVGTEHNTERWEALADQMYRWLRKTSTVVGQHSGEKTASGRAEQAGGGGSTSVPASSPEKSGTRSQAGAGSTSAPPSSKGDEGRSSSSGADQVGGGAAVPGEEAVAPPSDDCVHPEAQRTTTAAGSVRCKLCGRKL